MGLAAKMHLRVIMQTCRLQLLRRKRSNNIVRRPAPMAQRKPRHATAPIDDLEFLRDSLKRKLTRSAIRQIRVTDAVLSGRWVQFKSLIGPGDEVWEWESNGSTSDLPSYNRGLCLLRGDRIITSICFALT